LYKKDISNFKIKQLPENEVEVKDTAEKLKNIADLLEKDYRGGKISPKSYDVYNEAQELIGKNKFNYRENKWEDISDFYHKALKDGKNPKLVKLINDFLEIKEKPIEAEPVLSKDDLKKAEAKFAAAEDKFKKARNKIEDTQVKQAGMFGGEQKGMFAMGGEEAKKTLDPLRKAAKEAKAELDDIRNKIKVQEQAQPELKPIGKTDEEFIDNKIKLIKQQGKPLSEFKVGDKVFWASDWSKNWKQYSEGTIIKAGADYQIKRFSEHPESKRFKIFNLRSSDKVMLKPEGESNYTGQESISKTKEEVTPYQKALKEKQEAERKLTRQISGEKAAITRNVIKEASKIEPSDARSAALKYLAGANLSREAIDEVAGNVKRARLNTGERELKSEEARLRDYVAKKGEGDDLDEAVHTIWESLHGVSEELSGIDDREIKNALMQAISEHPTKAEAAQALIDGYKEVDFDAEEAEFYRRYNITPEEEEAETAKLEATLEKPGEDDYNFGKVPDEHINNLIEQYETEIKRQAKQPSERGKEKIAEKVSVREAGKPQEAKGLEETYKDLTKIEKRQIINSKFEELLKELKIEKICPTD
jgi:hypoxanthine phosphoribosyltransferase